MRNLSRVKKLEKKIIVKTMGKVIYFDTNNNLFEDKNCTVKEKEPDAAYDDICFLPQKNMIN